MNKIYDIVTDFGPFILAVSNRTSDSSVFEATDTNYAKIYLINPIAGTTVAWEHLAPNGQEELFTKKDILRAFSELLNIIVNPIGLEEYALLVNADKHNPEIMQEWVTRSNDTKEAIKVLGDNMSPFLLRDTILKEIAALQDSENLMDATGNRDKSTIFTDIVENSNYDIGVTYQGWVITYRAVSATIGRLSVHNDRGDEEHFKINRAFYSDPVDEQSVYQFYHDIVVDAIVSLLDFDTYFTVFGYSTENERDLELAKRDYEADSKTYGQLLRLFNDRVNDINEAFLKNYCEKLAEFINNL